jgi:hypothetical protein
VHFFWGGWDKDGDITGFEYLIAQNPTGNFMPMDSVGVAWLPVNANDSTFVFEPDSLNTARSFTFLVRAVDDEGLRSRVPDHRSFRLAQNGEVSLYPGPQRVYTSR